MNEERCIDRMKILNILINERGNLIENLINDEYYEVKDEQRNYQDLNRVVLKEELKKWWSPTTFEELFQIIKEVITTNYSHNEALSDVITNLMVLSLNSAEGNVFLGGVQHMDKLLVVKSNKYRYTQFQNVSDKSNSEYNKARIEMSTLNMKHEFVIGLILNKLRKEAPNFLYTYGLVSCNSEPNPEFNKDYRICEGTALSQHNIIEYIKGKPLSSVIMNINPRELGKILLCIFCALQIANERYGFCHYDLHSHNIMIREEPRPVSITYNINNKNIIVTTKYVPIIIDYGFSRMEYKGNVYSKPDEHVIIKNKSPQILRGNHPDIDTYKLISHLISILQRNDLSGRESSKFTQFFSELTTSLNTFNDIDYNFLRKVASSYNFDIQSIIENRYYYPIDISPNFKYNHVIDKYLIQFSESYPINILPIISLDELSKKLYSSGKCNNEFQSGFDKNGDYRTIFECVETKTVGPLSVITIPKKTSLYSKSVEAVYNNFDTSIPDFSTKDYDHLVSSHKITYYGDLKYGVEPESRKNGLPYCGSFCTYSYKVRKDIKLLNISDPITTLAIMNNDLRFGIILSLLQGNSSKYKINTPEGRIKADSIQLSEFLSIISDKNNPNFNQIYDTFMKWKSDIFDRCAFFDKYNIKFNYERSLKLGAKYNEEINLKLIGHRLLVNAWWVNNMNKLLPNENRNTFVNENNPINKGYSIINMKHSKILDGILIKYCHALGYDGFVDFSPSNPIIVIGENSKEFLERNYQDPYDWQFIDDKYIFGEIGKLIKNFSSSVLMEMSIWKTLHLQRMFIDNIENPIMNGELKIIIVKNRKNLLLACFLQDIGYINDSGMFILSDDNLVDMSVLLQECGMNRTDLALITFLVNQSKFLESLFKVETNNEVLAETIYNRFNNDESGIDKFVLISLLFILHVAKIKSSTPITPSKESFRKLNLSIELNPSFSGYYFNEYVEDLPFISNVSQTRKIQVNLDNFALDKLMDIYGIIENKKNSSGATSSGATLGATSGMTLGTLLRATSNGETSGANSNFDNLDFNNLNLFENPNANFFEQMYDNNGLQPASITDEPIYRGPYNEMIGQPNIGVKRLINQTLENSSFTQPKKAARF